MVKVIREIFDENALDIIEEPGKHWHRVISGGMLIETRIRT
jgi:hypothetical protein